MNAGRNGAYTRRGGLAEAEERLVTLQPARSRAVGAYDDDTGRAAAWRRRSSSQAAPGSALAKRRA